MDPSDRPGTWQPVGANDANLRAMVVNPEDLRQGQADTSADGAVAAHAVARYRAGKVKALPDSGVAQITPAASGGTTSAGSN